MPAQPALEGRPVDRGRRGVRVELRDVLARPVGQPGLVFCVSCELQELRTVLALVREPVWVVAFEAENG